MKKDTPELISSSQLFNSSIHSFITEEEEEDEEDDGVSAHVTAYKFAPALARVFCYYYSCGQLTKVGYKKSDYLMTLMMTQSLFISLSLSLSFTEGKAL